MYAISLLLSVLNKLSYKNIRYWGTYPKNPKSKQYIIDSGFLDVVKTNIKNQRIAKKGTRFIWLEKIV